MRLHRLQPLVITFAYTFSSAQSVGYHSELLRPKDDQTGGAWVVLANDSNVAIEAFHVRTALCRNGYSESSFDSLSHPYQTTSLPPGAASAGSYSQSVVVEPRAKFVTMVHLPGERDHCSAHGKIDTVLFSDGTYEGDKGKIRAIQAKRDGVAAAVRYWDARVHDERLEQTNLAVALEANSRAKKLQDKVCTGSDHSTGCEFWSGVQQVDYSVGGAGVLKSRTSEENFRGLVMMLDGWQSKIENDVALHKLEAEFQIAKKFTDDSYWSK